MDLIPNYSFEYCYERPICTNHNVELTYVMGKWYHKIHPYDHQYIDNSGNTIEVGDGKCDHYGCGKTRHTAADNRDHDFVDVKGNSYTVGDGKCDTCGESQDADMEETVGYCPIHKCKLGDYNIGPITKHTESVVYEVKVQQLYARDSQMIFA